MNVLQEALNNLDVVNFQIEQRERSGRDVPSVLLDQRDFYQAEVTRLLARPSTFTRSGWSR